MLITQIKILDKKKSLIYLEEEPAFALYRTEIRKYGICEDTELTEDIYEEIRTVLLKRCRERTAYLLGRADQTRHDLKAKLLQNHYPVKIIDRVVEEYETRGYVDDVRYVRNYIKMHISFKSERRIRCLLMTKGINQQMIEEGFDDYRREIGGWQWQREQQEKIIEKEFHKRRYDFQKKDRKELQRIVASLMRKGFSYEDVMGVCHRLEEE